MFARSSSSRLASTVARTQVRHSSSLPIPPKIATPKSVSGPGGNSARMDEVVSFYKALPKGNASFKKNAFSGPGNGKPLVIGMLTLGIMGYTIEHNMHLKHHKNRAH